MATLDALLERLEELLSKLEEFEEPWNDTVFEFLDGVDAVHRMALTDLTDALGEAKVSELRQSHDTVAWLFDAYGAGVDQRAVADEALDAVRPYIHSHGGKVEVLDAADGIVHLRMSGACSGCTAAAVTLQDQIKEALQDSFPGFVAIDVEEDDAEPHPPPPGPVKVELSTRPS